MVSMAADATARESGKSMARAVLAQVESDRSIVPDDRGCRPRTL